MGDFAPDEDSGLLRFVWTVGGDEPQPAGPSDYNHLLNRPQINGVTLDGNKTAADLDILDIDGDSKDNVVTFTSGDAEDSNVSVLTGWETVGALSTGDTHKSIFNKISTMIKNVRYLYKLLGTTDISSIGGGTITGAINKLNTDFINLGYAKTGSNSSQTVQVPSGTPTVLSTINIPVGRWIVVACGDWAFNASGYRQLSFVNGINPNRYIAVTAVPCSSSGKQTYQQLVQIFTTAVNTSITLYGLQNTNGDLDCYPYLYAARIPYGLIAS